MMMFGDSYDIEDTAYKYYNEFDCLTSEEIYDIINMLRGNDLRQEEEVFTDVS